MLPWSRLPEDSCLMQFLQQSYTKIQKAAVFPPVICMIQ